MRKLLAVSLVYLAPASTLAATGLLVPAYFDPSLSNGWNTLNASVSAAVPITAIMNPNNGPVAKTDAAYTAAINSFESAGGKVIAYVHTSYGSRAMSAVESDISLYESEYPQIGGIFLDEMNNNAAELSYYKSLYTYIKGVNSSWQLTGNPGTATIQSYLSPTPAAADVLVTFEDGAPYTSYTPSSWQSNFSAGSFANIAYNVSTTALLQADLNHVSAAHAGSIYITDLTGSNPYASLPSYWNQEVALVGAMNSGVIKSTYVSSGSGDFDAISNWSGSIPNAINAEADFLGAITANHTVYSDTAITAGTIVFNNAKSYVLAGAGSLTLEASSGVASVFAQAGVQRITLPITLASSAIFNASAGSSLIIAAPITILSGQTLTESGAGTVTIAGTITVQAGAAANVQAGGLIPSLVLNSGAKASILPPPANGSESLQLSSLFLAAGATLDVGKQDLIVENADFLTIQDRLKAGMISGNGIFSSAVSRDSTHLTALAAIPNNTAGTAIFQEYNGTAVSISDTLLKYTYAGDANLDGIVNGADYAQIDNGFTDRLTGWYNGDFNYDGVINGSDFTLIDNTSNSSIPANPLAQLTDQIFSSSVPEPGSCSMLAIGSGLLARRRRT